MLSTKCCLTQQHANRKRLLRQYTSQNVLFSVLYTFFPVIQPFKDAHMCIIIVAALKSNNYGRCLGEKEG